jgi:hypothetical protein
MITSYPDIPSAQQALSTAGRWVMWSGVAVAVGVAGEVALDVIERQFKKDLSHWWGILFGFIVCLGVVGEVWKTYDIDQASSQIQEMAVAATTKAQTTSNNALKGATDAATRAQALVETAHLQELIAEATADDAKAYDELVTLSQTASSDKRKLIADVLADRASSVKTHANFASNGENCIDRTGRVSTAIYSQDVAARHQSLAGCYQLGVSFQSGEPMPNLIQGVELTHALVRVTQNDSSLAVRYLAIYALNLMFIGSPGYPVNGFQALDSLGVKTWWSANEPDCATLLLLARASDDSKSGTDSIDTYEQLEAQKAKANRKLVPNIHMALRQMLSLAPKRVELGVEKLPTNFRPVYDLDACKSIMFDLRVRLPSMKLSLKAVDASRSGEDNYRIVRSFLPELRYVKSCPVDKELENEIGEYAGTTDSLSGRYEGVGFLNAVLHANLDPFNGAEVKDWWAKHKSSQRN